MNNIHPTHWLRLAASFAGLLFTAACSNADELPHHDAASVAAASSEVARNREVIRQHHDRLNRGAVGEAVQDYAEDALNHGRSVGRDGLQKVLGDIYATFPDWRMDIEEMIAADDSVVVRCKVSGTHTGVGKLPINGAMLMEVPPTGKRFEVQHIHWYQLKAGKIVHHRANRDDIGMLRQLGLLPAAPAAPAATPRQAGAPQQPSRNRSP